MMKTRDEEVADNREQRLQPPVKRHKNKMKAIHVDPKRDSKGTIYN